MQLHQVNKSNVAFICDRISQQEWTSLKSLELACGDEIRLAVDVLHWAGIIRSRTTADDIEYQWIRK